MSKVVEGDLDKVMEDDDWAIIFDKDGVVRGLFIPDAIPEGTKVPASILAILEEAGVDTTVEDTPVLH
jgi:hypothetical protein